MEENEKDKIVPCQFIVQKGKEGIRLHFIGVDEFMTLYQFHLVEQPMVHYAAFIFLGAAGATSIPNAIL